MIEGRYWAKAARALLRNLRDRSFAKEWLSAGLRADSKPKAHTEFLLDAYPELADSSVAMGEVIYRLFNLDPTERFCLAGLAQLKKPKTIFEFGTYDGTTTLLLARAAPDAQVITLDLPPEIIKSWPWLEQQVSLAGGIGGKFLNQQEKSRIKQLFGDSRRYDFQPYSGSIDLVLIDAAHEYESVLSDSESALKMLTPQGIIVWDDYAPQWPGVIRAVDEIASRHELILTQLAPTELVVYDRSRATAGLR